MKNRILNKIKETASFVARKARGFACTVGAAIAGVLVASPAPVQAAYEIVEYDDVAGTVAFTPENLTAPIVAGVVAAVAAGAVLFVIARGVRWIWRMLSTK